MEIKKKIKKKIKWKRFALRFTLISLRYRSYKSKKSLFIDCGSNIGQGYSYFNRFFSPQHFDASLIEPNPNCMLKVKERFKHIKNIEYLKKAVWTKNEKLSFFGLVEDSRGLTSTGGSVVDNHNSSKYISNKEQAFEVDAFSFSDFLIEKSESYKNIIVKMDIESAEYEVLKDLIAKKSISNINHLIIEFHSNYFQESERAHYVNLEKNLIKEMKSAGVGVTIWI